MAKQIVVGCKLPNGIVLEVGKTKVALNGLNRTKIIGSTHGTTDVDEEFWKAWSAENKEFPAFKSGAIFAAASQNEVAAMGKSLAEVPTGFEPMKKKGDKRAPGVEPATDKKD